MARKKFSKRDLEKRLDAFGRKCAMCKCEINGASGLEWDHVIPLKIGGEDTLENLQPLCVRDHRLKTKGDVATIAKTTRQRQRNLGIKKQNGRKIQNGQKPEKPVRDKLPVPPPINLFRTAS